MHRKSARTLFALTTLALMGGFLTPASAVPGTPAKGGTVVINEFNAINDANGNDYFELLVLGDGVDVRGLRVTNNKQRRTGPNDFKGGKAVYALGQDAFLENVPKGTVIAVWTRAAGVALDTTVNAAAGDWNLVLAPGTGVIVSDDGLGGDAKTGLNPNKDQLALYLPGPDGTSAGRDNIALDGVSWENEDEFDDAEMGDEQKSEKKKDESKKSGSENSGEGSKSGSSGGEDAKSSDLKPVVVADRESGESESSEDRPLVGVGLPGPAAYVTGGDCAALAGARNFVSHAKGPGMSPSTPGKQNKDQDLSECRAPSVQVPLGSPTVALAGIGILGLGATIMVMRRRRSIRNVS
jgi:hypothetical protein